MNILLISASAPPMNSPESIQVGRYLKYLAADNEVTLVTSMISGGWEPADEMVKGYLNQLSKIIRLRSFPARGISVLKKFFPSLFFPDDSAAFTWQTNRVLKRISNKQDIIYSRAAPFSSSLLAYKVSIELNIPWIMHLSDPWADSPFLKVSPSTQTRLQALEQKCIEHARFVTLTSNQTVSFYKKKYPQWGHKFKFLPNVFDEADLNNMPLDFTKKIQFVFTGRLYGNRSVNKWIDSIEKAAERNPLLESSSEFLFAGFFHEESITRLKKSPLSNVHYLGPLTLREASSLQHQGTVLIAIDALEENDERYNLFFPSKLLDYLAARRKIIAITSQRSTTHEVIDGKHGWCFNQSNLAQLPDFINQVIENHRIQDKLFFESKDTFLEFAAKPNAEKLQFLLKEALHDAN
jgi:glycosyltransferase involved in cell wall biosynthesis